MVTNVLSKELQPLAGRINDVDTHEMMPAQEWVNVFGKEIQPMVDYYLGLDETIEQNRNSPNVPGYEGDIIPLDAEVLNLKGSTSPGALDPQRRIGVMDLMGVSSQLVYATCLGILGMALFTQKEVNGFKMPQGADGLKSQARTWFAKYNEWAIETNKISPRMRPVALIYGDTPQELIDRAKHLIKNGIRAVQYIPVHETPGGRSPAHPDLDPLWAMLAEANVPFTLHISADSRPVEEKPWQNAPAFEGFRAFGEVHQDPSHLVSFHLPYERFISIKVLGGVFDRHPNLRVGVIECGSAWVGPMIRRLDMWYAMAENFNRAEGGLLVREHALKHVPSYYVKKNVRVTPYHFENIEFDLANYDVADVLCFSTDYPHVEGGRDCFTSFYDRVKGFGPDVIEKFFVDNGALLLPD